MKYHSNKINIRRSRSILSVFIFIISISRASCQDLTTPSTFCNEQLNIGIFSNNYLSINSELFNRIKLEYDLSLFNEKIIEQNNIGDLRFHLLNKDLITLSLGYTAVLKLDPYYMKNLALLSLKLFYSHWLLGNETMYHFEKNELVYNISAGREIVNNMFLAATFGYHKQSLYTEQEAGFGIIFKQKRFSGYASCYLPTEDYTKFLISLSLYVTIVQPKVN